MTEPIVVSDYVAKATASDLGIGPFWKSFRDTMVKAGVWKTEETP